jgi:hypothetical protein
VRDGKLEKDSDRDLGAEQERTEEANIQAMSENITVLVKGDF